MDDVGVLLVLLGRHPHLLERGEVRQNGPTDPGRVFSLRWRKDLDLGVLGLPWQQLLDLREQPLTITCEIFNNNKKTKKKKETTFSEDSFLEQGKEEEKEEEDERRGDETFEEGGATGEVDVGEEVLPEIKVHLHDRLVDEGGGAHRLVANDFGVKKDLWGLESLRADLMRRSKS